MNGVCGGRNLHKTLSQDNANIKGFKQGSNLVVFGHVGRDRRVMIEEVKEHGGNVFIIPMPMRGSHATLPSSQGIKNRFIAGNKGGHK